MTDPFKLGLDKGQIVSSLYVADINELLIFKRSVNIVSTKLSFKIYAEKD